MSKKIAKKLIIGDANEKYDRVWDYAKGDKYGLFLLNNCCESFNNC